MVWIRIRVLFIFLCWSASLHAQQFQQRFDSAKVFSAQYQNKQRAEEFFLSIINSTKSTDLWHAQAILALVDHYLYADENKKAIQLLHDHEKVNKTNSKVAFDLVTARTALVTGNYSQAKQLTEDLAKSSRSQFNPIEIQELRYLQAKIANAEGDIKLSMVYYDSIMADQKSIQDWRLIYKTLNSIAIGYSTQSLATKAEEYYNKALSLAKEHADSLRIISVNINLGTTRYVQYDNYRALEYFRTGEMLIKKVAPENYSILGSVYNNIGSVYTSLTMHESAIRNYRWALKNKTKALGLEHPVIGVYYDNLGTGYYHLKKYDSALFYMNKSIQLFEKLAIRSHNYAGVLFHKARVFIDLKKYSQAQQLIEQANAIYIDRFGDKDYWVAYCWIELSKLAQLQNQSPVAIDYAEKALNAIYSDELNASELHTIKVSKIINIAGMVEALANYARVKTSLATDTESLISIYQIYKSAFAITNALRYSMETESSILEISREAQGVYDDAINLAVNIYQSTADASYLEQAFAWAEASKSFTLQQSLQKAKAMDLAGIPPLLSQKIKSLNEEIIRLKKEIDYSEQEDEKSVLAALLIKNQEQYQSLMNEIKTEFPVFYEYLYKEQVLRSEQLQIKGVALVEYKVSDKALIIFVKNQHGFYVHKVAIDKQQLENEVANLMKAIVEQNATKAQLTGATLYQWLIEPVAEHLIEKSLLIIPDGVLFNLPFDILKRKAKEHYLIEQFAISYHYSAALAHRDSKKYRASVNANNGIVLAPLVDNAFELADWRGEQFTKLPWSGEEGKAISHAIGARFLMDQEATEYRFKQEVEGAQFSHLASHAFWNSEDPDMSFIALQPDAVDDGKLHAYEIYNLNAANRLIVLSACNSGKGNLLDGEGAMSLARAFTYAGAGGVVVSLWPVSDKTTAEIMKIFYREMSKGVAVDVALQKAKLVYLQNNDARGAEPYYWAAWQFIGQPNAQLFPDRKTELGWISAIIGLLVVSLGIWRFIIAKDHLKA